MPTLNASYWRDNNRVPLTTDGLITTDTQVFSGNNATVATPIFGLTGVVEVHGIWGVVTTDLGSAHTVAFFRLNDQTAQPAITLATGTTLSSAKAGSIIIKLGLAAAAVTLINNSAGRVNEPTTLETEIHSPFAITKKTAAVTNIEYVYTTTNTPTTGAMQFFLRWLPLSSDAQITAL